MNNNNNFDKGDVLLRREILLKVKSNCQTVSFARIFMTMNGHTYELFKNLFRDVENRGERGENTA